MKRTKRLLALLLSSMLLFSILLPNVAYAWAYCPEDQHVWSPWEWTEPGTCIEEGYLMRYCTVCGEGQDDSAYGDHDMSDWVVTRPATCTQTGEEESTCYVCGYTEYNTIPKGEHRYGPYETVREATCTQEGQKVRVCEECRRASYRDIPMLPHNYGPWVVVKEPDGGGPGIRECTCTMCGHVLRDWFNPPGTYYIDSPDNVPEEVQKIQEALNDKGYDCGEPDGVFGPKTEEALKEFQEDHGLNPDGVTWPDTVDALFGDDEEEPKPGDIVPIDPDSPMLPVNPNPGDPDGTKPSDPEGNTSSAAGLTLTKTIFSTPANGVAYQLGETVEYIIELRNDSGSPVFNVNIYDDLPEGPVLLASGDTLFSGSVYQCSFLYAVTQADVNAGHRNNIASASFEFEGGIRQTLTSDMATFVTMKGEGEDTDGEDEYYYVNTYPDNNVNGSTIFTDGPNYVIEGAERIFIEKELLTAPANGSYFVPGEEMAFRLLIISEFAKPVSDVLVYDPLIREGVIFAVPEIGTNGVRSCYVYYTITELDAAAGGISNSAYLTAVTADGTQCGAVSNSVFVPAGFPEGSEPPFGVITDMSVEKVEESLPLNGKYYTEGENIAYRITYTNSGEIVIDDVFVYDSLHGITEIGYAERLMPGESRTCFFNYAVTAADVAAGYVSNTAFVRFVRNGYVSTYDSNTVVSPTNANSVGLTPGTTPGSTPGTVIFPGMPDYSVSGVIDHSKLSRSEEGPCSCSLLFRDEASADYEVEFCEVHEKSQKAIVKMLKLAKTEEQLLKVWNYALELHQADLDTLYEDYLSACDNDAMLVVLKERVSYLSYVANRSFALTAVQPDAPALIAQGVSKLWEDHCVDLCYELSTAPAGRVDSLLKTALTETLRETTEQCSCTFGEETEEHILFTDFYCAKHGFTYQMTSAILNKEEVSLEDWGIIRNLWDMDLRLAYTALYQEAGPEVGQVYLAEYTSFLNWLNSRALFLSLLYPEAPEAVAETLVLHMMEQCLDLCEMAK